LAYILKVLRLSWGEFFKKIVIRPYTLAALFALVAVVCSRFIILRNLSEFLLMAAGLVLIYYAVFFFFGLERKEHRYLYDILKTKLA
jgi:hypothetical protein